MAATRTVRRLLRVTALVAVLTILAGCGDSAAPSATPPAATAAPVPSGAGASQTTVAIRTFRVLRGDGGQVACDALGIGPVDGTLDGDPATAIEPVWLAARDGRRLSVVWPEGFRAAFEPDLVLYDGEGTVVGRRGDGVLLQVDPASAAGTFADPYLATGILLVGPGLTADNAATARAYQGCFPEVAMTAPETAPPTARPTTRPTPRRQPPSFDPETVIVVATDGLRMRSKPRVADDSEKLEPLLARGTRLFVFDGPVRASGYRWYRVFGLGPSAPPVGWVAAAGKGGEPWLAEAEVLCPGLPPSTVAGLVELSAMDRLACFAGEPITLTAYLYGCEQLPDGMWRYEEGCGYFVDDAATIGLVATKDQFISDADESTIRPRNSEPIAIAPGATVPDPLPFGQAVRVTGMFGHPKSRRCTFSGLGYQGPSLACRLTFVVTDAEPVSGP